MLNMSLIDAKMQYIRNWQALQGFGITYFVIKSGKSKKDVRRQGWKREGKEGESNGKKERWKRGGREMEEEREGGRDGRGDGGRGREETEKGNLHVLLTITCSQR